MKKWWTIWYRLIYARIIYVMLYMVQDDRVMHYLVQDDRVIHYLVKDDRGMHYLVQDDTEMHYLVQDPEACTTVYGTGWQCEALYSLQYDTGWQSGARTSYSTVYGTGWQRINCVVHSLTEECKRTGYNTLVDDLWHEMMYSIRWKKGVNAGLRWHKDELSGAEWQGW